MTQSPDDLLDIAALHEEYGVPVRTLRYLLSQRSLPMVRLGRRALRVRRSDWLAYVEAQTIPARTDAE